MKKKICVITGTRAEYGLLFWILKYLQQSQDLELQIIVTGMHLSPEFGLTYKNIENDGFKIDKKIEVILSSDSEIGISKSIGLGLISFAEAYAELDPDLILILGDRYEIFAAASAAMVSKIPIGHIHGGEATHGVIDEPIRHSITKMSHLHFAATEIYKNRIIQLGESPDKVFNVGTPGLDNIYKLNLLDRKSFAESINFTLNKKNALVTFHPVTFENNTSKVQFKEIINAVSKLDETNIIFTKSNSDTNGRIINEMIDDFVSKNPQRACAFKSLGQLRYLSALRHVDFVLGNSSSGLTEAPSFKIPTIDVGDRQGGRIKAGSVINCEPKKEAILQAIEKGLSKDFQSDLKEIVNPYGEGGASEKIVNILEKTPLNNLIKKSFNDIKTIDS